MCVCVLCQEEQKPDLAGSLGSGYHFPRALGNPSQEPSRHLTLRKQAVSKWQSEEKVWFPWLQFLLILPFIQTFTSWYHTQIIFISPGPPVFSFKFLA